MKASILRKYICELDAKEPLTNIILTTLLVKHKEKVAFREISFGQRRNGVNSINLCSIFSLGIGELKVFQYYRKTILRESVRLHGWVLTHYKEMLFGYSLMLLMFTCAASPIYNAVRSDSSIYFTIGRGIKHGLVAHRDLADHKGLYLYFINYFAALISEKTTLGLFIINVVFMFVSLLVVYRISTKYLSSEASFILTLVFSIVEVNRVTYERGLSIEFYTVVFYLIGIYLLVNNYSDKQIIEHNPRYMFYQGMLCAIVVELKPNMVIFWIGLCVAVLMVLFFNKKFENIARNIATGVPGG